MPGFAYFLILSYFSSSPASTQIKQQLLLGNPLYIAVQQVGLLKISFNSLRELRDYPKPPGH